MSSVQPRADAPLFVLLNVRSGDRDGEATRALIGRLLNESGRRHELIALGPRAAPVQVGLVNDRVFLVNASLGLYPQLLEDREQFKARLGRNRVVALIAACATLLREHRGLRLGIELNGEQREVRATTLFVGNNRLQLEQVGIAEHRAIDKGEIAAVMLKPVGTLTMIGLLLRGALGTLGDAEHVESFQFRQMTVRPWLPYGLPYGMRRVKVAFDGEIAWLRTPLTLRVSPRALHLMLPDLGAGEDAA
jgi:diacylglycerol kinase family enzyme